MPLRGAPPHISMIDSTTPPADLSELPHIETDKPLRYPPISQEPAGDVLDHPGSSYETVQPDSAIYDAVVRRWEGADIFGLVPLRPIEVNLIGLAASSLDDEDGEAWWKDWPAQPPPTSPTAPHKVNNSDRLPIISLSRYS